MVLAPELVGLIATFALLCALVALSFAYDYTLGALLKALARLLDVSIPLGFGQHIRPFSAIAGALNALDNTIRHGMGVGIAFAQYGFNRVLHSIAYSIQEVGHALDGLASDTRAALHALRHASIPRLIAVAIFPLGVLLAALEKRVGALAHAVAHAAVSVTHTITHEVPKVTNNVTRITKRVYVSVPAAVTAAVAVPWGAIHGLERDVTRLEKWVKAHQRVLTETAAAGLVGAALARLGLGWTRCSKVSRLGKSLCGLNENVLDDFLTGALIVASSISVVELARECQAFTVDVNDGVRFFVRELH